MRTRESVAAPALFESTKGKSTTAEKTNMEFVLTIDPSARFYHYGPHGTRNGWVMGTGGAGGNGWETAITWSEARAWEAARMQLETRGTATATATANTGVLRCAQDDNSKSVVLTPGDTYPLETDDEGNTLHSQYCQALFARRDWRCARCLELLLGAMPRRTSHAEYLRRKLRQVQRYFLFPNEPAA